MENKSNVDHTARNFIIKIYVCCGFIILLILYAKISANVERDRVEQESIGHRVETLEYAYYDENYAHIRMFLQSYDMEYDDMDDPVFDVYREALKAYEDFASWRTWYGCIGTELDAEAQIKEPELREAVYANAENCVDARNQKKLDNLVEEMEALMDLKTGEDE